MGAGKDIGRDRGINHPPAPVSLTLVGQLRGRWGGCWWSRSEGSPPVRFRIVGTRWRCPQVRTDPIQIVDDLSIFDRQFADQLLLAVQASVDHVGEAEVPIFDAEYRNIGDRALGEIAQFLVTDFMGR